MEKELSFFNLKDLGITKELIEKKSSKEILNLIKFVENNKIENEKIADELIKNIKREIKDKGEETKKVEEIEKIEEIKDEKIAPKEKKKIIQENIIKKAETIDLEKEKVDIIKVDTPPTKNEIFDVQNDILDVNTNFLNNNFLQDADFEKKEIIEQVEENKDDTNKVKAEPTIDVRKETNFAELIPEEEKEIKQDNSFLNRVKNVLINVKEKVKNKESVIGDEEGPGIKKEIKKEEAKKDEIKKEEVKKKEIKEKEKIKEIKTEKKSFFESLKEKFMGEKKEKNFFSKMLDKVKSVINKKESQVMEENYDIVIPERIKKKYEPKKSKKELLYESEVEQALKDKEIDVIFDDKENEFIEQEKKEKEYMEDEDYTFFLNERELKQLSEKEKIIIPMVLPKKKEFVDYSVNRFPEEILSNKRTNLNKHIPILTKQSDIEKMIIGLIDNNDIQNFRAMVDKTSNLNQVLTTQYALLTYATKNRKYDIMKFLIFSGADINKKDNKSETPLTTAIKNNDFKAVQILIDAGANLNEPDVLKRTPLIYAIEKNYEDIAIYLIEKGADINITNAEGEGTLSIATRLNRQYIKKIILEKIKGKTIQ